MKEIAQARLGADVRVAVRGVGNRAVHAALDAGARQCGHAGHGVFNVFFQTLEIVVPQLVGKVVGHAVQPHGRGLPFIRPEDEAFTFLAQVIRGIRVAQQRQARVATRSQFGYVFGHQILVRHHDDRQMAAHHGHHFTGAKACSVDNDLGGDFALIRGD